MTKHVVSQLQFEHNHIHVAAYTCRRAAIFLATSGVGVANVHRSFRVALAMSALAMAITIWEKLGGGVEKQQTRKL